MKERFRHFILLIILIGIDQITKYWVRTSLTEPINIIPGVLSLESVRNTGAAWNILADSGLFLRIFTLVILVVILFLYFRIPEGKKYRALKLLAVFIIAGAIGNMIDRFFLGYVVDFIYFEIINFPLFNFADSCLTVSSILLFLLVMFRYKDDDLAFMNQAFKRKKDDAEISGQEDITDIISKDDKDDHQ